MFNAMYLRVSVTEILSLLTSCFKCLSSLLSTSTQHALKAKQPTSNVQDLFQKQLLHVGHLW